MEDRKDNLFILHIKTIFTLNLYYRLIIINFTYGHVAFITHCYFLPHPSIIRYHDRARCDTSLSARKYIPRFCLINLPVTLPHFIILRRVRHGDRFNLYCRRRMIKVAAADVTKAESSSISTAESARCAYRHINNFDRYVNLNGPYTYIFMYNIIHTYYMMFIYVSVHAISDIYLHRKKK